MWTRENYPLNTMTIFHIQLTPVIGRLRGSSKDCCLSKLLESVGKFVWFVVMTACKIVNHSFPRMLPIDNTDLGKGTNQIRTLTGVVRVHFLCVIISIHSVVLPGKLGYSFATGIMKLS